MLVLAFFVEAFVHHCGEHVRNRFLYTLTRRITMKGITLLSCLISTLATVAQVPKEKTLLWKIEGNGLKSASYLYGTMHLMCPDDITIHPKLTSAFNSSSQLLLELDMDDPKLMFAMMGGMAMKDTFKISSLMSKKDFDSVSAIFKSKTGMSLTLLNKTKPILLMTMIYPSMLGCAPEGWEGRFQAMAKEKGIELKGLETIEEQMAVFDSIPYKIQAEMFKKTMYSIDSAKQTLFDMVKMYKTKDIDKLYRMSTSDEDFGKYDEVLLNKRNRNWISRMAKEMKSLPTFFAVGAGHLGGPQGVISLLRKKGYKVSPVMY